MSVNTRTFRPLLFVLPLLALGCNGSSPTEPLRIEPQTQPKAAVAATAVSSAEKSSAAVIVEDRSGDELRPGAARLALRQDGLQAPAGEARPTAPIPVAAAARGGNGNGGSGHGGGNGNGGGGNSGGGGNGGNGGHGGRGGELSLEIQPDAWNTNWVHSEGTVQAFVRGGDVAKIDTSKVQLVAPSGDTLDPTRARVAGGQLVAFFAKDAAFKLLGKVHSGDKVELKLRLTVADKEQELSDTIRIVGPEPAGDDGDDGDDDGGELNISPDDWNTNWAHSAGQVKAFLRGDGLKDVDLDSIRLVGDKADAKPLKPVDVRLVGHQIVASFAKSAAYKTLDDPDSGETHTVKITFKQKGADKELSEDVHIEGP